MGGFWQRFRVFVPDKWSAVTITGFSHSHSTAVDGWGHQHLIGGKARYFRPSLWRPEGDHIHPMEREDA